MPLRQITKSLTILYIKKRSQIKYLLMLSLWSTLSPSSDMYPGGGVSVVGRGRGGSRVGLVTGECCSKVLILLVPGLGNCVFSGTELLSSPPLPVDGNKDD